MLSVNKIHRYSIILLVTIFLWSVSCSLVNAASISPKLIELDLEQRDIIYKTITLTNSSKGTARLYPFVNEISVDENGEIKAFEYAEGNEQRDSITSWIEVSRGRITIPPGESVEVPVTIKINPNAEADEYHALISFPSASNKDQARAVVEAGRAPGTIVRIGLAKKRTEFLNLKKFFVERFVVDTNEEVMDFDIANTGQEDIAPRGEVIFYDTRGNEVSSIAINPDQVVISEGQEMSFVSALPDLPVGKYKAFLSVDYGTEQLASLTDTVFFYVMPIHTMLLILGVVMAFAVLLTVVIYRRLSVQAETNPVQSVSMYLRDGVSDSQDHDIDLKKN